MTEPERHDTTVGRIRMGVRGRAAPTKIERWRLTSPLMKGEVMDGRAFCPICRAYEGSKHLGSHSFWRRLVAALARYAR